MKYSISLSVALGLACFAFSARADTKLGGAVQLLPVGSITAAAGGDSETTDADTAVGLSGFVEFGLGPNLSIGLAPRLLLNVKGESGTESAEQLDLAVRLVAGTAVGTGNTRVYGFIAPGYSVLFIPDWPDGISNPAGLILGFGGGLAFKVQPGLELTTEIGYQLGFQSVTEMGETLDLTTKFLHLGFGVLARL